MTVKRFVTSVLAAACLVVAAVHTSEQIGERSSSNRTGGPNAPIPHVFLDAGAASASRISCPVIAEEEITRVLDRRPPLCWLGQGWGKPYDRGTWVTDRRAVFEIHIDDTEKRLLEMQLRAAKSLAADTEQTVRLAVNGTALETRKVRRHPSRIRIAVPSRVLRPGTNTFVLEFAHLTEPETPAGGRARSPFAATVSEMAVVRSGDGTEQTAGPEDATNVWDPNRESLVIGRPGTLVAPVYVPADASSLVLDLRASLAVATSQLRARLAIADLDGKTEHASEVGFPAGRSLTFGRLPVDDLAGRWALVTLSSTVDLGHLEVENLRFVNDASPQAATRPFRASTEQRHPNIVLITLDAARGGSFGFAGYHRDTTPFIDSLAAESLVFPNAYALVPYTLCSVPTMITGLSFLDHRVDDHEDVLSPDAVTLAEVLRDAGYLTAAFSATPNNSRAKGFDQGYEVFRQMWTEGEKKTTRRAPFIARQVTDWLAENADDGRPLHLQVHMVPPHAPYDPPQTFDRFTDPDYDGPCNGWPATIDNLNAGVIEAEPDCIEQVHALYDGNLSVADDAVRTIVEALRDRPDWENTVVLITADHGEAFWEHGRLGHNSTIYREMLHVPFVLRMPAAYDTGGVDTDGLTTLADIVPTLLHAAGLAAPPLPDALDLLAEGADRSGRAMVTRTTSSAPVFGVRTLRWSLMVNTAGSGALFDGEADWGEAVNLVGEQAPLYAGLSRILATRLGIPPQLDATRTDALDADERELLKTLGYIR